MASMAMVSCLDFSPEAQMNDDSVWSKANNFQLFANQFYGYTHDIQSGATVIRIASTCRLCSARCSRK